MATEQPLILVVDDLAEMVQLLREILGRNEFEVASFVDGRYVVERKLGEGGKGIVFLCQDTTLGRRVAIKLIKEEVMDPDSLARFQREVQARGQLAHPNVVTIHDVGQEVGRHFLVLELVEGGHGEHLIADSADVRLDTATVARGGRRGRRRLAPARPTSSHQP